jgi:hypothetical protein
MLRPTGNFRLKRHPCEREAEEGWMKNVESPSQHSPESEIGQLVFTHICLNTYNVPKDSENIVTDNYDPW